jgi:hypothetical protein
MVQEVAFIRGEVQVVLLIIEWKGETVSCLCVRIDKEVEKHDEHRLGLGLRHE